jgi:MYXO-CTERM domain-containing protein
VVDAGPRDAGSPVTDAGPRDSGAPVADAGTAVDAGSPPVADAGTKVDAGTKTDAGSKSDAGSPAEQTFGDDEGKACSCTVVGSTRTRTAPFAWAVLAGFVGLVAARRRR